MQEHQVPSISVVLAPHSMIGIVFMISSVLLLTILIIDGTSGAEVYEWDRPKRISETENLRVEDIAVFEHEIFVVAMGDNDAGYGIYLRHLDGQRWSDWIPLHGDKVQEKYGYPKVAVGGDGVAHVVWIDYTDDLYNVMYRSYDGQLGPEMNISEGWPDATYGDDTCDVAAWSDEVYVTWCGAFDDEGIFLRHYDGTNWLDMVTINDSPIGASRSPSIAMDGGEVWIAWIGYPQAGDSEVYCKRFDGESWHSSVRISTQFGSRDNSEVDIAIASGRVHVAWRAEDLSKSYIHQRSYIGGAWGDISVFNSTTPLKRVFDPDVSAEGDRVVLSWQDQRDGSQDIYLRIDNGTGWGEEEQVNWEIPDSSCHDAVVTIKDGVLHITWCWWNDTLRHVYYRRCLLEDNDPPKLVLDLSDKVATTGDPFKIAVIFTDNVGVLAAWCVWYIGDVTGNVTLSVTMAGHQATIDVPTNSTGMVGYVLGAVDTSGLVVHGELVKVNVRDDDPPTVGFQDLPTTHERGTSLNVTVLATDNTQVAVVRVYIGESGRVLEAVHEDGDLWRVEVPGALLMGEDIDLSAEAVDPWRLETRSDPYHVVLLDTTPPVVTWGDAPSPPTTGDPFRVLGHVEDISGIPTIHLEHSLEPDLVLSQVVDLNEAGDFSVQLAIPSDGDSALRVRVEAVDGAGNVLTTEWLSWDVVDNDPPTAVAPPTVRTKRGDPVPLSDGGSHDNVGVVNWIWNWTEGGSERILSGQNVTAEFGESGTFEVTLWVSDAAGNWDEVTVTVEVVELRSDTNNFVWWSWIVVGLTVVTVIILWFRYRKG